MITYIHGFYAALEVKHGRQEDRQARRIRGVERAPGRTHEQEVEDGSGLGALAAGDVEAQEEVMALSREDLGRRIEHAREAAELSQTELGEVIDLSQSAISRIESGFRNVDSLELAAIARALDVSVVDLLEERPLASELRVAARRQDVSQSAALDRAIERVVDLVRLDELLTELDVPQSQPWDPLDHVVPHWALAINQGRGLAEAARQSWDLGDDPLPDLLGLVEDRAGVGIQLEPLTEGLDGLFARAGDASLILVDSSPVPGRQRFTVAHELCHFLLDEGDLVLIDERITAAGEPREIRANAFAAHFLMPVPGLTRYVAGRRIDEALAVELQFTFGVSLDSLLWHLLNCRMIDDEQREAFSARGAKALAYRVGYGSEWERNETEREARRPPRPLVTRALIAYDQGKIGIDVVAHLLRRDREELRGELESFGIGGDVRWWESDGPA